MTDIITPPAPELPGPLVRVDRTAYRADANHMLAGRKGQHIKCLIIHNTETQVLLGNAPSGRWLSTQSPGGESAHHLYGRDGTRYDIVDRADTAYHAGVSQWGLYHGQIGSVGMMNLISVGHELESSSTHINFGNGYTEAQINACAQTVAGELLGYGLPSSALLSHAEIAQPPGRRWDPSHFDWTAFRHRVDAWLRWYRALDPLDLPKWII